MGCKPERIAEPPKCNVAPVGFVRFAVDEFVSFVEAFQDADDPLWMHLFYSIAVVSTDQVMLLCSTDDPMQHILSGASPEQYHIVHFGFSRQFFDQELLRPLGQHRLHTDSHG